MRSGGIAGLALTAWLWAGCQAVQTVPEPGATSTSTAESAPTLPAPTLTVQPTPVRSEPTQPPLPPAETRVPQKLEICSPLEGQPISQLAGPDLLKNPFDPPRPGYDDGHFGIDLAYWSDAAGKSMQGLPVRAILAGTIAGVIPNRYPYGYAVIVETPLELFPPDLRAELELPEPALDLQPAMTLSCPETNFITAAEATSIYTLYGHLDQPPPVSPGDPVGCGDVIGGVGTTGRSVNLHLHLETRHGPAGMRFASLAHYDNSATQEEMRLYCLWRISGAFAPFDPLVLFDPTLQDR